MRLTDAICQDSSDEYPSKSSAWLPGRCGCSALESGRKKGQYETANSLVSNRPSQKASHFPSALCSVGTLYPCMEEVRQKYFVQWGARDNVDGGQMLLVHTPCSPVWARDPGPPFVEKRNSAAHSSITHGRETSRKTAQV